MKSLVNKLAQSLIKTTPQTQSDSVTNKNVYPLHEAVTSQNWEAGRKILLHKKKHASIQDAQGNLPLHVYWWSRKTAQPFLIELINAMSPRDFEITNYLGDTGLREWILRALVLDNALFPVMNIKDLAWELKQMNAKDRNLLDADANNHTLLHDLVYYVPSEHTHSKKQSEYIQQLAKLLIAEGVPSDTKNSLGFTPKDIARTLGYQDLVLTLGGKPFDQTSDFWQTQNAESEAKLLEYTHSNTVAIIQQNHDSHLNINFLKALFKIHARTKHAVNTVFQMTAQSFPVTISQQLRPNLYNFIKSAPEAWRALDEQGNTILYHLIQTVIKQILNKTAVSQDYNDHAKETEFFNVISIPKRFSSWETKLYLNQRNKFGISPETVWRQWLHQPNNSLKDDFFMSLWSHTLFLDSDHTLSSPISGLANKPFPFLNLPDELQIAILKYLPPRPLFRMRRISKHMQNTIDNLNLSDVKQYLTPFYQILYLNASKKDPDKRMTVKKLQGTKMYTLTYLIAPEYLESFYRRDYLTTKLKQVNTTSWEFKNYLNSLLKNPTERLQLQQKLLAWPILFRTFKDAIAIKTMDEDLYKTLLPYDYEDESDDEDDHPNFNPFLDVLCDHRSMALLVLTNPMTFNIFQELVEKRIENRSASPSFGSMFLKWVLRDEEIALAALTNQRFQKILLRAFSDETETKWLQTILFASIQQQLECPLNERSFTYDWVGGNGASALYILTHQDYHDKITSWSLDKLQHAQTVATTQLAQNSLQMDAEANFEQIVSRLKEIITSYQPQPTQQLTMR